MSLPVTVIFLVCMCLLHAHAGVGNNQANCVCYAHVHQIAFELYRNSTQLHNSCSNTDTDGVLIFAVHMFTKSCLS